MEMDDYVGTKFAHSYGTEIRLNVPFKDAAKGITLPTDFIVKIVCDKCLGSGSEMGYTWNICPYCEGTGKWF